MNNAEFVKEARKRQQWAENLPDDPESLLAAWACVTTDLSLALEKLEAAERRIEDEAQQNRAEISALKAALKAADDRAEMARQGNLYVETFPKPPYIATCKTEELP